MARLCEQALGQLGQGVKGVVEVRDGRSVGKAKAQMVRRNHVIAIGQRGNQVAEHIRAGRESVQQYQYGRIWVAGLTEE